MSIRVVTILGLGALIAGCATYPWSPPGCATDCSIQVQLPSDPGQPPSAPEIFRVVEGTAVSFPMRTRGIDAADTRMVLAFGEAAFQDAEGNPVYTLELSQPGQHYRARAYADGVCRPPAGCRYVLVNVGNPHRPAVINSPRVIIDPR